MAARAFLAALAVCSVAAAAKADAPGNPLATFQQREGRLFDTGWNLARANRAFCTRTAPDIGLLIHDARNYARAAEVRRALQLTGDIGVQAVAAGSPAAHAGLVPNATLDAVDALSITYHFPPTAKPVERTLQIERAIAASLSDGEVALTIGDPRQPAPPVHILSAAEICAARFRLTPDDNAFASADAVFFGNDFMAFGEESDVFAAAVAHELAHVIQGHVVRKERERWGWRRTRDSEREADRMIPWLLFNAGYDPDAAAAWMRAWGPKHSGGLLRKRTHDGWDERLAMILAETAALRDLISANGWQPGDADWSQRFPVPGR